MGQFLLDWAHNSVQKYNVSSNISQATHLLVQFTSGQIGSRVPCPYTMHGAQCLQHAAKVVVVVDMGGEDDVHYGTLAPCGRMFVKK